jgi:hypothetical protein
MHFAITALLVFVVHSLLFAHAYDVYASSGNMKQVDSPAYPPLSVRDCRFILFAGGGDGFSNQVGLVMKPQVIMCVERIAGVDCESYTISVSCQTPGRAQYSAYTFFDSMVVAQNVTVDCNSAPGSVVSSNDDFVLRNEGAVELVVVATCIQPIQRWDQQRMNRVDGANEYEYDDVDLADDVDDDVDDQVDDDGDVENQIE